MCDVKLSDKAACVEFRERLGLEDIVAVLIISYDSMVMCCERMTLSGFRNICIL